MKASSGIIILLRYRSLEPAFITRGFLITGRCDSAVLQTRRDYMLKRCYTGITIPKDAPDIGKMYSYLYIATNTC